MDNAFGGPYAPIKSEPLEDEADTKPRPLKRTRLFGSDPFSADEERSICQKLDVGLSRQETMQRPGPGGSRLTYIEGWKVIHDANQIFGFNGWSSQVVSLDLRFVDEANHRFSACVCATVRITLRDGAYREDRGGGSSDNLRSKGDAILKAEKEAVTDATKRALKNFGLRLGLSLYDKQHVRDMNRPQPRMVAGANQGAQTPQASRAAPGVGQVPRGGQKGCGSSPTTPGTMGKVMGHAGSGGGAGGRSANGARVGAANEGGQQFAAQREQALKRRQAFLQAKAAEEKARILGADAGGGARSTGGYGGGRGAGMQGQGSGVGLGRPGSAANAAAELARRQREIDELSRMALADL